MLTSVIATDYNRVVCIRQTRNDEEVTDWWKWWAIMFLYKKKKKTGKRVHLQRKKKRKRKKEKLLQDESTVTAPGLPPPPLSPPLSLPPPPSGKKTPKCGVREGERGGRNDSGLDGWWWMKQWRFSSGASVWCWGIWCHTAAVCRTLVSSSVWPLTCLLCLVWLIYNDPWDKNINILMPNKMCVLPTWHGWEGHIFDAWVKWFFKQKKRQHLTIFFTSWHCIFFSFSY